VWVVNVASLALVTLFLPGFWLDRTLENWWVVALILPIEFALLVTFIRPILVLATLPLNAATLGAPTLFFNGILLYLSSLLNPAFKIGNLLDAFIGLTIVTVINTVVTSWLGIDENYQFFTTILKKVGLRYGPHTDSTQQRGLLILQIDGLSFPTIQRTLRRGRMPALSAMLARGHHKFLDWQSGVPSNTPAVQGGLFYGKRGSIPGYRWYDREKQRIRCSNKPEDLRDAESIVAKGVKPLLEGGSSINSLFSGGASNRLLTLSAVGEDEEKKIGEYTDFSLFWLNPWSYSVAWIITLWEFFAAIVWHLLSRFRRRKRIIKRTFMDAAGRALANAMFREASFFWIEQDMERGMPIIYSNFIGYDEVAHCAGPDSSEAMSTLTSFDRKFQRLRRIMRKPTGMKYDLVLLSDHGQSSSVPLRHAIGETIEELVTRLAGGTVSMQNVIDPRRASVVSLMGELDRQQGRSWLADSSRRTLSRLSRSTHDTTIEQPQPVQLVVCPSGGLAHIYREGSERRLNMDEIRSLYPGLIEGLASCEGIEFVIVLNLDNEPVLIGKNGVRNLVNGEVVGDSDPLAKFSDIELWNSELLKLANCEDSGDLIINGAVGKKGHIVAFEEQIGSHGGLGGSQNEPFIILPKSFGTESSDLRSPEALYRHFIGRK